MVWLKRLAWCVAAVLGFWVVVWLAVPPLLKWQLPLRASEALGRQVTLGDVRFQPWNLDLTLNDIAIAGLPGAKAPLLQIKQVHTNLSAASLFRLAPVIEALEVDALRLNVARISEGHYDVDDLIARLTPKPDAKPSADSGRFALYNVQVRDAQLRFDDRPVQRVQAVDALNLTLPFISDLPAQVEIKVEPRLAFKLNGTPFDSGAQATPFAQTRSGDLRLAMTDLDLVPYLGYLPAGLPVKLTKGSVSADINVNFALPPGGAPSVTVKGQAGAKDIALTDTAGAPLLEWRGLALALREVQPLARKLAFENLRIDGLQLHASRDAAGRINLLQLAPAASGKKPEPKVAVAPASGASAAAKGAAPAWQVSLDTLALADARVLWNDAAVKPAAALQIDTLSVDARQLQWPLTKSIPVVVKGALHTQATGGPALAQFTAEGPVTDHDAKLGLELKSVSLAAFAPYLAQTLVPTVAGQLAGSAQLDWSGAADAPRLQLTLASLTLDNLKVREAANRPGQDAVALKQLALADVEVDLLARTVVLGKVRLVQPTALVTRDQEGKLNLQGWMVAGDAAPAAAPAPAAAATRPPPVWHVQLKDLLLEGGQLRFADAVARRGASEPVRVELASLRLALQNFEWQGERAVPPAALQLSARVGGITRDRQRPNGALDYKGRIGIAPLLANGNLKVERFPVQLFAPYFADQVALTLLRAEAGYTGSVDLRQLPAGIELAAAGDVLLGDVHVASLAEAGAAAASSTDELLSWQAFALKGVKLAIKPQTRPQIEIADAALTDLYARLLITEQGRFNLQDVAGAPAGKLPAAPAGAASAPPAAKASANVAVAAAPPASAASGAAAAEAPLPVDLRIGGIQLANGKVDFTDNFVRPNYSAALTELNGALGAFSSSSREMATLQLRGRAAGTALLDISGQLNPMAKPLALDIKAKASDLELAPLSTYAGKYVGYAIERGKLSMNVAYKIDPDGRLAASNQVILNQLTFGEKIESKDAIKLPVLFAVALLKDRNGVIDVNLPISGSLNDPKFSVGGIVWQVIVNLLTKAITSPFSLLAGGGGGGGDDLSVVEFRPGTAQLTPGGTGAIDKVAKALVDRPALKMTVTGDADPATEHDALQSAALDARLAALQRRERLSAGTAPAAPASAASAVAPPTFGADERARLLKELYKDTDIPNKPRNVIGFAKDIPGPEMEALLKSRLPVTDEAMRALALQRGLAVRDALIAKGLPAERLFLAAPKLRAAGDADKAWSPRVQLTLSAN